MIGLNILDIIILIMLFIGGLIGFKKGIIKSSVSFIGLIIIVILSFFLKNPLSVFFYTYLPFLNIIKIFNEITILNILIYEAISFLIVFAILYFIFKIILRITGIVDKILKSTLVLTLPLKLLGLIFGLLETLLIIIIGLFMINSIKSTNILINQSKIANVILKKTPVFSKIIEPELKAVAEIYELKNCKDKISCNQKAFIILLKYDIISEENAKRLVNRGSIKINNINKIINEMKGKENDIFK